MTKQPGQGADWPQIVGVLGLGIMGSSIARHLVTAGRQVVGYDPDPAQCRKARETGVVIVESPTAAAEQADLLLSSLPSGQALDDVVAAITSMESRQLDGLVMVDLSTLSLDCKVNNRDRLAAVGVPLLDCPISGTGAQAATGDIAIFASGASTDWEKCRPVFADFARADHYLGEFGNGTTAKLIANLLVAIHNVATAEAIVLGERSGLDLTTLCEVIASGGGTSRVFELRSPLMIRDEYEPATMKLDVWQKDLDLISEFATKYGVTTPLFSASSALYESALADGRGQQDTAAVCSVIRDMVDRESG
ncbi:MAG: NAD(P)-dependent oxidoreductase [Gammaproteobacteria bacterium]|nr:NAD(P)-dependent oxidoreductase [Gammaproteobacteria bacterium]